MNSREKSKIVLKILNKYYPKIPIPLNYKNNFTLLVSVLLSAQCTDKRVNLVTPDLFKAASTPQEMIKITIPDIQKIIRPCGLSERKAKSIYNLSKILIEKFNGEVPENLSDLESLPGVGHKTASVVMAQAFGVPSFPVDTHIHRLAQQWQLTNGKNVVQTEKDLKRAFPEESWNRLHLQIIFYGREYCTARQCDGLHCQLCSKMFPNRKRKRDYKKA